MKKTILPAVILCAASVCAAEIPDMPAAYRADPAAVAAAASKATTALFPDADRVVVDDRIHVAYEPDGTQVSWDDEWIKVLTEKGRRSTVAFSLDFSERYGDAKIFLVEIVGVDGKVRKVDFEQTLKVATDNSSLSANIDRKSVV